MKRSIRNASVGFAVAGALAASNASSVLIVDVNSAGNTGTTTFNLEHISGATEGLDLLYDRTWESAPLPVGNATDYLRAQTTVGGVDLQTDSRPLGSVTPYNIDLIAIDGTGDSLVSSANNYLQLTRVEAPTSPDKNFLDWNLDLFGADTPASYSGTWDLLNHSSLTLPSYNLTDALNEEIYGTLRLTPSNGPIVPEPTTGLLGLIGAGSVLAATGRKNHMSKRERRTAQYTPKH